MQDNHKWPWLIVDDPGSIPPIYLVTLTDHYDDTREYIFYSAEKAQGFINATQGVWKEAKLRRLN